MIIPIRHLLALRPEMSDQVVLDYLTLVQLRANPGTIATSVLRERWACSQSQVSRRMSALASNGLVDITPGWSGYQVHAINQLVP